MSKGFYLTIGVNHVSSFYTASALSGCVNDAKDVARIAESQGFQKPSNFASKPLAMLTDSEATRGRVLEEIKAVASQMSEGDLFLLHYSGHGLENGTTDETGDVDTCWATFDRPLIDNELFAAWFDFPNLSRILVLSDSCHSGTVIRSVKKRDLGGRDNQQATISANPEEFAQLRERAAAIRATTRGKSLGAGVMLISGCRDEELSSDGDANGLFTANLKDVWDNGAFSGDYRKFHQEIARRVAAENPQQNPQRNQVGNAAVVGNFAFQKPFQI